MTTYAQAEFAHASDVKNLETTAVFNEKEDCFYINSSNGVGSYKCWSGDLGKHVNWIFCFCQVYTKDMKRGVFPLFFQVRDMNTHK